MPHHARDLIASFELPGSGSAWVEVHDFADDSGVLTFTILDGRNVIVFTAANVVELEERARACLEAHREAVALLLTKTAGHA